MEKVLIKELKSFLDENNKMSVFVDSSSTTNEKEVWEFEFDNNENLKQLIRHICTETTKGKLYYDYCSKEQYNGNGIGLFFYKSCGKGYLERLRVRSVEGCVIGGEMRRNILPNRYGDWELYSEWYKE